MRWNQNAINQYQVKLQEALDSYHITYRDAAYGTLVSAGADKWIIEYGYDPEAKTVVVNLFHGNVFFEAHASAGNVKYPDYHLQFRRKRLKPGELAGYIFTHQGKYVRKTRLERLLDEA